MDYSLIFYLATISNKFLIIVIIAAVILTFISLGTLITYFYKDDEKEKETDYYMSKYDMSRYSVDYVEKVFKRNLKIIEDKKKEEEEENKKVLRTSKKFSVFAILCWILFMLVPSKDDIVLIVGGGKVINYLTTDSVITKIPNEVSTLILKEIKELNESEVNPNVVTSDTTVNK